MGPILTGSNSLNGIQKSYSSTQEACLSSKKTFANKKLNSLLSAYRNRRIYTLWPYNNHHANFEIMLINAWYAGKILYPEQFLDISIPDKADEILTHFVGHPITEQLTHHWGNYRNLFNKIH